MKHRSLKEIYNNFLDKLFPVEIRCLLCGKDIAEGSFFCEECSEEDIFNEGNRCLKCDVMLEEKDKICDDCKNNTRYFERCFCPLNYNQKVRGAVVKFKDKHAKFYAKPFAKIIYNRLKEEKLEFDFIVPVPAHINTIKRRGYDPVKLLADELSLLTKLPVKQAIIKNVDTSTQKFLTYETRQENIRDSITRDRSIDITDKRILLLDDVVTTCATINSCAMLLGKAKVVYACALARTTKELEEPKLEEDD